MSLTLSPQRMTFDVQQKVKYVKLTNTTTKDSQPRPLMFKIKTNKIELVDAKPSCGYISGKQGHNDINVAIRWLNNTNDHSAKLQILFVENGRITEEMVERNGKHFDNDEYNQNYEAIKKDSQSDVKTILLPVARKIKEELKSQKDQEVKQQSEVFQKVQSSGSQVVKSGGNGNKEQVQRLSTDGQSGGISLTKCLIFVFAAFLIGLLAGFSLGKRQIKQEALHSLSSVPQEQVAIYEEESVQTGENNDEAVSVRTREKQSGQVESGNPNDPVDEQQANEKPLRLEQQGILSESSRLEQKVTTSEETL